MGCLCWRITMLRYISWRMFALYGAIFILSRRRWWWCEIWKQNVVSHVDIISLKHFSCVFSQESVEKWCICKKDFSIILSEFLIISTLCSWSCIQFTDWYIHWSMCQCTSVSLCLSLVVLDCVCVCMCVVGCSFIFQKF